jgi:hypothetical protein
MGMTVRFPNGQAVTYNDANFLTFGNGQVWSLYTKDPEKGGRWLCSISPESGAIVESVPPCKVENPLVKLTGEGALDFVLENAEEISKPWAGARKLAELKKKLARFSTRSKTWRRA